MGKPPRPIPKKFLEAGVRTEEEYNQLPQKTWDDVYFEFNKQTGRLRTVERDNLMNWLKETYFVPKSKISR